jgi:hypothetical protein
MAKPYELLGAIPVFEKQAGGVTSFYGCRSLAQELRISRVSWTTSTYAM